MNNPSNSSTESSSHPDRPLRLAGLEPVKIDDDSLFVNVGERTNVTGSKAFARMILEDRFEDALDYTALVKRLKTLAADHTHQLMERFADALADVPCSAIVAPCSTRRVVRPPPPTGCAQSGASIPPWTKS